MGRIIAFDIGDKRVGVAITDPFGEMALPLESIGEIMKEGNSELTEIL